jgi:riboflavin biosynthesis pyrimidine reductase
MSRNVGLTVEPLWEAAGLGAGVVRGDGAGGDGAAAALSVRGDSAPAALAARYPGGPRVPLHPDRPTVLANFVSSIDGVVGPPRGRLSAGGGEISGGSETDRLVMALLRALADAVLVGAGTLRNGRRHVWTARHLFPAHAADFAAWRSAMGLAPQPTTVVVSGSGAIDPAHAALNDPDVPAIVATTEAGAAALEGRLSPRVRILALAGGPRLDPAGLVAALGETGLRLLLCEGGPGLFGELLAANLVDELFLTVAPQLIGAPAGDRPLSLGDGIPAGGAGHWGNLVSVRRAADDLYLRYRLRP